MTEERALLLFARCYNRADFAPLLKKLRSRAAYEAYNRLYVTTGRENVERLLNEKAAQLRALPKPNRAWHGFMIEKHDVIGTRCMRCVVLTADDPRQVEGVVRILCSPLGIRAVRVLDPAVCNPTRGDYAGKG